MAVTIDTMELFDKTLEENSDVAGSLSYLAGHQQVVDMIRDIMEYQDVTTPYDAVLFLITEAHAALEK